MWSLSCVSCSSKHSLPLHQDNTNLRQSKSQVMSHIWCISIWPQCSFVLPWWSRLQLFCCYLSQRWSHVQSSRLCRELFLFPHPRYGCCNEARGYCHLQPLYSSLHIILMFKGRQHILSLTVYQDKGCWTQQQFTWCISCSVFLAGHFKSLQHVQN